MEIMKIHHGTKPVLQLCSALMIITDMAITQDLSSIPKLCSLRSSSNSDSRILSTLHLKHLLAINMFAFNGRPFSPDTIITLRALLL